MKAWSIFCWISLGALIESLVFYDTLGGRGAWPCALLLGIALTGWGWSAVAAGAFAVSRGLTALMTGRPCPLPRTDPQALAEELAALNAQLAQLRDTATSFDVSFDQTLHRMDDRLRRVEQQSPYLHIHPGA